MRNITSQLHDILHSDFLEDRLKLPSFPGVALQVAREVNKPSSTARSVAEIVAEDPILTGRVFAVANSSGFPGDSNTVTTLPTAVGRLGLYGTRNVVMAFSLKHMSSNITARYRNVYQQSIVEAQQLAATAHTLASYIPKMDAEAALAFGLLCDIGKIPILARIDEFDKTLPPDIVAQCCNSLHPLMGGWVLSSWKMWQELVLLPTISHHWYRPVASNELNLGEVITAAKILLPSGQALGAPSLGETPIGRLLTEKYEVPLHDDGTIPSALASRIARKQTELLAA
ncbi:MAG: HDOD domain-containing protein [Gammaproteobacteria bacterium]|nr:HDOD domain-containing protein [Gammaproteobacteria bacterium]